MPGMPERRTRDYARHVVIDLFAALNIADGAVISQLRPQHRVEKDIKNWIKHWNAGPKPFVWKKTAEEILDSLAKYIQRINGAGH